MVLAVVSHEGMSGVRALERLRRIDPEGVYDLNHVFFESGARAAKGIGPQRRSVAADSDATVVGLIDTGVAKTVDLTSRVRVMRRNFVSGDAMPGLHGTAVAALLARRQGRVTIYAADIFGAGPRGGTTEFLLQALGWMAGQHVPVINISIVGPPNALVASATRLMIGRGFTLVAPVGNDGAAARLSYPASYPGVIAVSAADANGSLLPEASRVKRIDFVAPGIASVPDLSGRDVVVRGTSFAAPVVSRLLADHIRSPDVAAARQAVARLGQDAIRSKADRKWSGRGLIGMAVLPLPPK